MKEERRIYIVLYRRLESRHVKGKQNRRMRKRKGKETKEKKLVCRECSNCACMRVYVYTCVRVNVRVYVFVCALAYDVIAIGRATINSKRNIRYDEHKRDDRDTKRRDARRC